MSLDREGAALIGVDWGTSSARAYLFGHDGQVLGETSGPWGVSRLPGSGDRADVFASALTELVGQWTGDGQGAALPMLASGMVGSRAGWREVPYRMLPAPLLPAPTDLGLVTGSRGEQVHLVPGLHVPNDPVGGTTAGVLRGEETELVGATVGACEIAVLPGTHSKWVRTSTEGRVSSFTTFLTGELFHLLATHSTVGAPAPAGGPRWAAYIEGVQVARDQAGRTALATLFTARARHVTGTLPAEDVHDYLSGLLIGAELVASEAWSERLPLVLIGSATLTSRYARAAVALGWADLRTVTDAAPRGLWRTARHVGLIP